MDNILGSNQNVSNDSTPAIKDLNISLTPIYEGVKNQLHTKPSMATKDEKIKISSALRQRIQVAWVQTVHDRRENTVRGRETGTI